MKRQRLDLLMVERGLADSREKAQRLIRAGEVLVDDAPAAKPGHEVPLDCHIRVRQPERFVGRGGLKLEEAFVRFPLLTAEGKICVDIGASTGGFTDCLLQHGAAQVFAVDVGKSQLHPRLAADPRVVVLDGCNARHLQPDDLPEPVDLAVTDVSFISLRLILPAIDRLLRAGGETVALIKPQFEAGRNEVEKGGVVRNPQTRQLVVERIRDFGVQSLGWQWLDFCPSPIRGPAGNVEYLSYWRKGS
ncbi:MAG TPA: TlyA family RNA methyltransferase [Kiritimatiellia bacterium]|nr:TlyA family RNA methyltransferase [Kiritimatiellia bacterium]HQQ60498.1 TlyA family RNA methyltransferase [Kiritimatiellia bacterium]